MATTTNYGFKKRALGHPVRDDDIGVNLDMIDTEIHNRETDVTINTGDIATNTADIAAITESVTVWAGTSNFAGPGGVTITHNHNLSNYVPIIILTEGGDGYIGEIHVSDIAVNSFVVRNTGSETTEFTWVLLNKK